MGPLTFFFLLMVVSHSVPALSQPSHRWEGALLWQAIFLSLHRSQEKEAFFLFSGGTSRLFLVRMQGMTVSLKDMIVGGRPFGWREKKKNKV